MPTSFDQRRISTALSLGAVLFVSSLPRTAFPQNQPQPVTQPRYTVTTSLAAGPDTPPVVILHDITDNAEAAVAPSEGGELSSYRVKFQGRWIEFLYHARDYSTKSGFQGKGPLLWPAIGPQYPVENIPKASCGDGTYPAIGKTYPMPCHGFARMVPWTAIHQSADAQGARVTVQLRDSDITRKWYPYAFTLNATYELANGLLTISYDITSGSSNAEPMPFSIGNHIAYKLPFVEGTNPADMTFQTPNTTQLLRNPSGTGLNGQSKPNSFATPRRLGDFDSRVALPLAGYHDLAYALVSDPGGVSLRITQTTSTSLPDTTMRFNVYGGPGVGYFCPEPYFGLMNSLNSRQGLVTLHPGQSWKWRLLLQPAGPPPPMTRSSPGVERFGSGFGYIEGPVWSRDGSVIFSDMLASRILQMKQANQPTVYREDTRGANGNSMDTQGRLYSAEKNGRRVVRREKDGSITVIASEYQGKQLNDPNDVVVRRDGQVYFSDPTPADLLVPLALDYAGVYHVDLQGNVSLVTKMPRPNGVALTPDGKTLLIADTKERHILAYDLDAQGNATNGRTLISDIDGGPDGLRVAANGNIYIAARGVAVYNRKGTLLRTIEFPETPANLTFGDQDLRTVYVTARTSIYRVRVPDEGSLQY